MIAKVNQDADENAIQVKYGEEQANDETDNE
jgi:hypothetical protein